MADPITAAALDRAGIPHWRERLADARIADETVDGHGQLPRGQQYPLAWQQICAEYRASQPEKTT